MDRIEKLSLLAEILEAIKHFENEIVEKKWSNDFGAGLEWLHIRKKNTHNIEIYKMCIDRLNLRFSRQLLTLK